MSNRARGVTLIELVVAIAIVGIALAALVAAYNRAGIASTDPVITRQMLAIGETMMEEVLLKPYVDQVATTNTVRAQFDELLDYQNYAAQAVSDAEGTVVAGLDQYTVAVAVERPAAAIGGVAAGDVWRVRVTVARGAHSLVLTGWRTRP